MYDELTYQIAKKAAANMIAAVVACTAAATTGCPAVGVVSTASVSVGLVASALAKLSDEASNPIVVMNKATWGDFKAAQYAASYPVDPFEGLPVVFNNTLPAKTAASTGDCWMIVGDFNQGAIANFPNGNDIEIKFDDLTKMEYDLIRILGREFVGVGVVANNAFTKVVGA